MKIELVHRRNAVMSDIVEMHVSQFVGHHRTSTNGVRRTTYLGAQYVDWVLEIPETLHAAAVTMVNAIKSRMVNPADIQVREFHD